MEKNLLVGERYYVLKEHAWATLIQQNSSCCTVKFDDERDEIYHYFLAEYLLEKEPDNFIFYGTFGQNHQHENGENKNCYVEIVAVDIHQAMDIMKANYGKFWGNVYTEDSFDSIYFPNGCFKVFGDKNKVKLRSFIL